MYLYTYILHYELIIFAFFCIKEEITLFTFPYTREDMWVQTRLVCLAKFLLFAAELTHTTHVQSSKAGKSMHFNRSITVLPL